MNRPVGSQEEYDLDLVCLFKNLSKTNITQEELKDLLGQELQAYAKAHGMNEPPEERKRCWRMDYADEVKFHIDNLPCVPETFEVMAALLQFGVSVEFAQHAIALTCKEHPNYDVVSNEWPTSNPVGFAIWFEERFASVGRAQRDLLVEAGKYKSIDLVPAYELKTPLQSSIQVLKRHRDFMYREQPDLKPISMIITTLAAQAYNGEATVYEALAGILERMPKFIRDTWPKVPNPVNPGEDFADKWRAKPVLEQNFWDWYRQVVRDFRSLSTSEYASDVQKLSESRWGITLPQQDSTNKRITIYQRVAPVVSVVNPPRPWSDHAKRTRKT